MVDNQQNQTYNRVEVSALSDEHHWPGVPTIHKLTNKLMATLSPQLHEDQVTLQIALFDTSNPFEFIKVASCPIRNANGGFNLSQLAYNEVSDKLLVFVCGDCFELKLEKLRDCGHLTKVPDFVKTKQLPDGLQTINAIYVRPADKTMFFIMDQSYCTLASDGETFSTMRPYSSIHPDAEGQFMGFQPSLSPDTYLLLFGHIVFQLQFVANEIRLNPARPIVRVANGGSMWAVREIAENTLIVGFFNKSEVQIYQDGELQRSIEVGMRVFGFVLPPSSGTPTDGQLPQKIIALDNARYAVIDLKPTTPAAEATTTITNIHTGIGGYMPRYESYSIEDSQTFGMTTLCQTDASRANYLASFVFNSTTCEVLPPTNESED